MFSFGAPTFAAGAAPSATPVQWYYYLSNDPRGRLPDGWYEYDTGMNLQVEQLFQTSQPSGGAFGSGGPSHKRRHVLSMVASSGYQYELDFHKMSQINSTSRKERPIFRSTNGRPPSGAPSTTAAFSFGSTAAAVPAPAAPSHTSASLPLGAASALASAGIPFSFGGSGGGGGQTLNYVAPELLHEVKVDDAKIFVDVQPPEGKIKAKDEQEEKKNGESSYSKANEDDDCVICLDSLWGDGGGGGDRVVAIKNCGHRFHYQCIHEALTKGGGKCPLCSKCIAQEEDAQTSKGKCPSGTMTVHCSSRHCQGYNGVGSLTISYQIPSGTQKKYHPQPGFSFSGANRTAYLPDNREGKDLLARICFSFMHGLCFMVGTSLTTGQANTVTWASIHHKTSQRGGTYGFPDPSYFDRSNDEMDQLGVPNPATCRTWLQNKCPGFNV